MSSTKIVVALVAAAALSSSYAPIASAAPAAGTQGDYSTSLALGTDWSKGTMAAFRQAYK